MILNQVPAMLLNYLFLSGDGILLRCTLNKLVAEFLGLSLQSVKPAPQPNSSKFYKNILKRPTVVMLIIN